MAESGEELMQRLRAAAQTLGAAPEAGAPRREVWRDRRCVLYRYEPVRASLLRTPLLICYALVNRPTMLDLQPGHSLIRNLLEAGVDVYLIDWGYPQSGDRFEQLADYVDGWLDACVREVGHGAGRDSADPRPRDVPVNLLGVCQGGALSLCYAALHPAQVRNLITMVTPVDFQTPRDLLSRWARDVDLDLLTGLGNVPGTLLNAVYLSLMPFRLTQQKYLSLARLLDDEPALAHFLRVERWILDSPDQAACAFGEFVKWFYQENRLLRGTLSLRGRPVDLRAIRCPLLNVYGLKDHLVPPEASRALHGLTASADYQELAVDAGHIGLYVSRTAQTEVAPAITRWLAARDG